jgi:hypothetical protein
VLAGNVNWNWLVAGVTEIIGKIPLKPAGVTFLMAAMIGEVELTAKPVGSVPRTVAVAVVPLTLMLVIWKNGSCVGPVYGVSRLLPLDKMSG